MTTITPATRQATSSVIDVHVVTGTMVPLAPLTDGDRSIVATFRRGDIIEQPDAYRPDKLAHAIRRGAVTIVPIDLDRPAGPARTYTKPAEPVTLARRGLPRIHHLEHLIDALEQEGCTVTGADHYRAIKHAQLTGPTAPERVLDLTVDQLLDHAERMAIHRLNSSKSDGALAQLHQQADREQAKLMAAEVDTYLDHLRPHWNQAVTEARAVIDAGVPATATPDTLVDMDPGQVAAWSAFRASAAIPTLERITGLRTALADKLNIAEGPDAPHHSYGITNPVRPSLTQRDARGILPHVPPVQRWLEHAHDLDLVPVRDFTTEQRITAAGLDPEQLRAVAQRIHHRNTIKEND